LLVADPQGTYVDATLGHGGHAAAIVASLAADAGRVIAMDCDPDAVARASARPPAPAPRFLAVRGRFSELDQTLDALGLDRVDGLLADLGLSSDQLDDPARGLAFSLDGPLDMRLDPARPETADALIRRLDAHALARLLAEHGELPRARAAAGALHRAAEATRPLTTRAVRDALAPLYPGPGRPRRLAQAFQALRVAVNREIPELTSLLESAARRIKPGGTLVVIAYHSLEDRIVKHAMAPPRPMDAWVEPAESPWLPLTRKPKGSDE